MQVSDHRRGGSRLAEVGDEHRLLAQGVLVVEDDHELSLAQGPKSAAQRVCLGQYARTGRGAQTIEHGVEIGVVERTRDRHQWHIQQRKDDTH